MVLRALRFPCRIVSRPETPPLLRDGEVWLHQRLVPLPPACEATMQARFVHGGCLAPWGFLRRGQSPVCPVLRFPNKVFCRTHRSDREWCSTASPMREQGDRAPVGSTAPHQYPRPAKGETSPAPPRDSAGCNAAASKQNVSNCGGWPGKVPCRIARQTSMMRRCNEPCTLSRHHGGLRAFLQSAYRNPNGGSDKDRHNPSPVGANCGRSLS